MLCDNDETNVKFNWRKDLSCPMISENAGQSHLVTCAWGKHYTVGGVLQSSGVQFMDDPDAESGISAQLPVPSLFLSSKDNKHINIIGVC